MVLSHKGQVLTLSATLSPKPIPSITHVISRGFQTTCNHKLGYHDSCILYKG
jgi:hypothetical protein